MRIIKAALHEEAIWLHGEKSFSAAMPCCKSIKFLVVSITSSSPSLHLPVTSHSDQSILRHCQPSFVLLGTPQDLSTPQLPLTLKDLHLLCPRSLHCFSSPFRNTHDKVSPLSSTASSRVAPYELVRSTRRLAPASLPLQVSLAIGVLAGRPEPDASASVLEVVGPQS